MFFAKHRLFKLEVWFMQASHIKKSVKSLIRYTRLNFNVLPEVDELELQMTRIDALNISSYYRHVHQGKGNTGGRGSDYGGEKSNL